MKRIFRNKLLNYLRSILSVTQAGSHRSEIDLHVKTIKTPFLLKSVFFQLLDVLAWFKMYVDSNPKTENWVKVETATEVAEPELLHSFPARLSILIPKRVSHFSNLMPSVITFSSHRIWLPTIHSRKECPCKSKWKNTPTTAPTN
jgi:hypothetical protein